MDLRPAAREVLAAEPMQQDLVSALQRELAAALLERVVEPCLTVALQPMWQTGEASTLPTAQAASLRLLVETRAM